MLRCSTLMNILTWKSVQRVMDSLTDKRFIDCKDDKEVFDEYSLFAHITIGKLRQWNIQNLSTDDCWVEIRGPLEQFMAFKKTLFRSKTKFISRRRLAVTFSHRFKLSEKHFIV